MCNIYQAITTRYIGPTNFRGSRIKAKAAAGSVTISYDDSLNSEEAHAKAAQVLANKFGWEGDWYQGGLPDDRGYCFVNVALRDLSKEDSEKRAFQIQMPTCQVR